MTAKEKNKAVNTSPAKIRQISKKRLWLFRIIAIVFIPIILFGSLELGLRIFGSGYPTKAIIKYKINGKEMYCHNFQFGWQFFPENIAREFDGFVFETDKSPKTYRIFVLGASAAKGTPAPSYNFGRILEVMLSDMYPDINFEVHNTAMVAINSHVVPEIAKDCAEFNPDLFIVYLGNNEVIGPFGQGTVFSPLSPSLSVIRANIAVKSTRIGQLIERLLRSAAPNGKVPLEWKGMSMFLQKQVRHNSTILDTVYSHYKKNLQDICNAGRQSGADVIVSNVGVNLKDSPPFASLHRDDLTDAEKQTWEEIYQQGINYEASGAYQQAIDSYLSAAKIDETFADLQFRLGRNYWQAGNYETARQHYLKALQYDTLRFRADARINDITRSIAEAKEKEGIYFADAITAFKENSPHQTPGQEMFYEHVHLNFKGNYILAKTIFSQTQKTLPASFKQSQEPVLSEKQCAERLAYTNFERYHFLEEIQTMVTQPPFTNQLYHDEAIKKITQQIKSLSTYTQMPNLNDILAKHKNAIQKTPDNWHLRWRYAVLLGEKGLKDTRAEEVQLKEVIQRCPYHPAYLALGRNLSRQNKMAEARKIFHQLLEIKPNSAMAHFELAILGQKIGDNQDIINKHLTQMIRIQPAASIENYTALAQRYEQAGNPKKALRILYKGIDVFPEDQERICCAHSYLGYILYTQEKYEKAFEEMKTALKINPDCVNKEISQKYFEILKTKLNR